MAIWSSEWPPFSHIPPHRTLFKRTPTSLTSWNPKLFLVYSSSSPPTLLEDASHELKIAKLPSKSKTQLPSSLTEVEISTEFIRKLCKSPQTESLAFEYYLKARQQQPKFHPDATTLKMLIETLFKSKRWDSISALVEDCGVSNVFPDRATCSKLVKHCILERKFKLAELILGVFEAKQGIAVSVFGSAMWSYNKLHMYRNTVAVYNRMVSDGLSPDSWCYYFAMDAHHKLGDTDLVLALFHELESKNINDDKVSAKIYSCLCESLGKSGRAFEALRYFREMVSKGIAPNRSFYKSIIGSFASIKEAEIAEDLFQEARDQKMVRDPALFQKLVLMYIELGSVEKTISVVEVMMEMGVRVSDCIFCAVLNGHVRRRGLRAAVKVYEQMVSLGCEPGQVTYTSILNVYYRLGLTAKAEVVFFKMLEKGYDKCLVAYSNMITLYGKNGKLSNAMRLLAKMKERGCEPNVWVYNSLLDMHGRLLNVKQVDKIWKEMKRRRIEPDKISYTSTITAYSKSKEFDECMRLYHEYRSNGGKLDRTLAGVMVGVFSKCNRVDELLKLLQEIQSEGRGFDGRLYKSSLNALRDAGLQSQVKWFKNTFAFDKDKT